MLVNELTKKKIKITSYLHLRQRVKKYFEPGKKFIAPIKKITTMSLIKI